MHFSPPRQPFRRRRPHATRMPVARPGDAAQMAAVWLSCRIDWKSALQAPPEERRRLRARLRRAIEKERLRARAWGSGYDLDRHLALKAFLDRLSEPLSA